MPQQKAPILGRHCPGQVLLSMIEACQECLSLPHGLGQRGKQLYERLKLPGQPGIILGFLLN